MIWNPHESGVRWIVSGSIAVASFTALSARSLPGMLEYPGTQYRKMDDEMDDMHGRMDGVPELRDESVSHSDWLSVYKRVGVSTEFAFV